MTRQLWVTAAMAAVTAGLVGCGEITPTEQRQYDVTGIVTTPAGKPVSGLNLNFQPTGGTATPVVLKLGADGTFRYTMSGGEYTWFLSAVESGPEKAKSTAALKSIPEKYQSGSLDRRVKVDAADQKIVIQLQ